LPVAASARRRGPAWSDVLCGLIVLAAIAAVAFTLVKGEDKADEKRKAAEKEARSVATEVVVAMTSVNPKDLNSNLETVKENSTGDFKDQFEGQREAYIEAVKEAGVSASGAVVSSGVVSSSSGQVVLLLAVSSTVRNEAVPDGDGRAYRMRVTVSKEDAQWLVSSLQLVA